MGVCEMRKALFGLLGVFSVWHATCTYGCTKDSNKSIFGYLGAVDSDGETWPLPWPKAQGVDTRYLFFKSLVVIDN